MSYMAVLQYEIDHYCEKNNLLQQRDGLMQELSYYLDGTIGSLSPEAEEIYSRWHAEIHNMQQYYERVNNGYYRKEEDTDYERRQNIGKV